MHHSSDLSTIEHSTVAIVSQQIDQARLAQSVERKALNLVVVGSSPTVGVSSSQACQSPTYVTFEVELP